MLVCGPFFMDRYELVFELIPKVTVPAQKDWIKQPEKISNLSVKTKKRDEKVVRETEK